MTINRTSRLSKLIICALTLVGVKRKGVSKKYTDTVKDMYEGVTTSLQTTVRKTKLQRVFYYDWSTSKFYT